MREWQRWLMEVAGVIMIAIVVSFIWWPLGIGAVGMYLVLAANMGGRDAGT